MKAFIISVICLFIAMNFIAFFHAYRFTHFTKGQVEGQGIKPTNFWHKIKLIVFGVPNAKPKPSGQAKRAYTEILIPGKNPTHAWYFAHPQARGTVVLGHGYASQKTNMLDRSEAFFKMGYHTLLIDFMGCGQSLGYQTSLGFYEAQQVADAFRYLENKGHKNIILYGKSMGAVAISKAMKDHQLPAKAIILESAFGEMHATVCARFRSMGLPAFPMANLLTFWGSVQNQFWAFGHNPILYAKQINYPSLVMVGLEDEKVSWAETQEIYQNIPHQQKKIVAFPGAGHENLLQHSPELWLKNVEEFLLTRSVQKHHPQTLK